MTVLWVAGWREQVFPWEVPGIVPVNKFGPLSRELEMTPRGGPGMG